MLILSGYAALPYTQPPGFLALSDYSAMARPGQRGGDFLVIASGGPKMASSGSVANSRARLLV